METKDTSSPQDRYLSENEQLYQQLLEYAGSLAQAFESEKIRRRDMEDALSRLQQEMNLRQEAENELRGSEARFRAIFDSAQDCIFIKDRDLKYSLVNPFTEKLFDLTADRILGLTDNDLFGPEIGDYSTDVERRVLAGDIVEQQHTRTVRGVSMTFLDIRTPLKDADGNVVGICGISRNISGREPSARSVPEAGEEYPSAVMNAVMLSASSAARSDSTVLLTGESGTGKDYLAKHIHDHSARSRGPFFAVNCAAVPQELAEAELFGHEPGAFTGASGRVRGLLELAEGGTLLLNEIGELSLSLQAKLLSFLDSRSFTRVGGRESIRVSARIIAATNRDLQQEIESGQFRSDLFYRLNVFSIELPPLRSRLEDLPALFGSLARNLAAQLQRPEPNELSDSLEERLRSYHWPGNVRELKNVLERALILSPGPDLNPELFPSSGRATDGWSESVGFPTGASLDDVVTGVTKSIIEEALRRTDGGAQAAADLLNISRHALKRRMASVGLRPKRQSSTDLLKNGD